MNMKRWLLLAAIVVALIVVVVTPMKLMNKIVGVVALLVGLVVVAQTDFDKISNDQE